MHDPPGPQFETAPERTLSVIIPVYEQPDLLRDALESVHHQTIDDFEVIVVDDGSDVDFTPICDEYDDHVRLITHEENQGAAAARNTGMAAARGQYFAFLDADDMWDPGKLERQVAVFEDGAERLGLVYTGFVQYELDGSTWERYPEARGDIHLQELERDRIHPTSTVMVDRRCIERVGGFDTALPSRQDYDLWIRVTEHFTVDYVDEILVDKREQPDSISKDFHRRIEGDLAVFEKVKDRTQSLDFVTRSKIHSYHHHVIGRDYDSNGEWGNAVRHLGLAIIKYPFRPISWVMFVIALFNIDRSGRLVSAGRRLIR